MKQEVKPTVVIVAIVVLLLVIGVGFFVISSAKPQINAGPPSVHLPTSKRAGVPAPGGVPGQ